MAGGAPLSLRYHSDQLNNKVLGLLREFYLTGEFCDVVLHVGGTKISAHRIVLAAFSPYFRDLFHQPASKTSPEITLPPTPHLREEAVRQLVDFCYSSDITVDSQSADKILAAASFLQIKEVEKLCITFMAAQQALKSEQANQPHVSPVLVPTSLHVRASPPTTSEASNTHQKGDNSRELACADTSGIGSNHTSPRHSSRPSSVPSGNGSVAQPLEDPDLGDVMVEVKKEQEDDRELSISDPRFFTPPSSSSWIKPDYETLRTSMANFPRFFFPPVTGALSLPTTPSHHQLLMKALTTSPSDLRDFGELYMRGVPPGSASLSQLSKDEGSVTRMRHDSEGGGGTSEDGVFMSESSQTHQCHICLKLFQGLPNLKAHLSEHQDTLTVPTVSTYKMMSPVRKLSTPSSLGGPAATASQVSPQSPVKTEGGEEFGGSNMCGTCGKTFRDPQSLKFHRYNHVLRYQCNYCGKRFSRSWNLHRHRKTHYRQLQDSALGPLDGDVTVIDVDSGGGGKAESVPPSPYSLDKDKILTSPYADYRNHRHDMMPFAFDMRRLPVASTYSSEEDRERKSEDGQDKDREREQEREMMPFAFDMRRFTAGTLHYREPGEEEKGKPEDLSESRREEDEGPMEDERGEDYSSLRRKSVDIGREAEHDKNGATTPTDIGDKKQDE